MRVVEGLVPGQISKLALDPAVVRGAVREANAGRDVEFAKVVAEVTKVEAAHGMATKAVNALLDAVEQGSTVPREGAGQALRLRLRRREEHAMALRVEMDSLTQRRAALCRDHLDADLIWEEFLQLAAVLEATSAKGADAAHELQALLRQVVSNVEWKVNPADSTRGTATFRLNPGLKVFPDAHRAWKGGRPSNPLLSGSLGRPGWLPRPDRSQTSGLLPMRVVVPWERVARGLVATAGGALPPP